MSISNILLVDDDQQLARLLSDRIHFDTQYRVLNAFTCAEAETIFNENPVDFILLDLHLPDGSGLDLMQRWLQYDSDLPIVILTAHGSVDLAVKAMDLGACYFLTKPCPPQQIIATILRFMEKRSLQQSLQLFKESSPVQPYIGRQSKQSKKLLWEVEQVAQSDANVLITGESGTGKEIIARLIHPASARRDHPFVKVDCTLLSEQMLESDLFGHEKGAFTGAYKLKKGRIELADGGSVFFDEIGDLPLPLQAKLLRIIQEHTFEHMGGTKTLKVDVRIIAATNHDLAVLVKAQKFREDLFYRLNVVQLHLAPLRKKREDIPELIEYFLHKHCARIGAPPKTVSDEAMRLLTDYPYPGNVRELQNLIERILVFSKTSSVIQPHHLPREIFDSDMKQNKPAAADYKTMVQNYKRTLILNTLQQTQNRISEAAKKLNIPRTYLYQLIKDMDIPIKTSDADLK